MLQLVISKQRVPDMTHEVFLVSTMLCQNPDELFEDDVEYHVSFGNTCEA